MPQAASIDTQEVAKFTAMAEEWWDEDGKFKPLHRFNPVRVQYIRDTATAHFGKEAFKARPLAGLTILDVGCGGGLLAEPMARMGASVTAIDASDTNIRIASLHAKKEGLDINYRHTSAEELAASGTQFDIVLNMEVIEHVADVPGFLAALSQMVKPGGLLYTATLNRTVKSYALAIIGAEYILRWLPRGTHDWQKFLRPSEITASLESNDLNIQALQGVTYHPLQKSWHLSRDVSVNYMMIAEKLS